MGKIKKGLVGITLGSILAVSGCADMLKSALISEEEAKDMRKSQYVKDIREAADERAKSNKVPDLGDAMRGYGCICETEKMDESIRRIIRLNIEVGTEYAELGEKYHKMCKK